MVTLIIFEGRFILIWTWGCPRLSEAEIFFSWLKYIQYIYFSSNGGKYNAMFRTMLLFRNHYLLHLYFYASESCPVQLFPFCWPQSSKRSKMPCSSIVLWFPHDWDRFLSVPVCLCSAIGCHQCEKDTSYIVSYFSRAARGSVMKGLFKRRKSTLKKPRKKNNLCSTKCIHKACHRLSCVLWTMHSNRWS